MNIAYLRVSKGDQDTKNQKYELLEYCDTHNLKIDKWVEVTASTRGTAEDRKLDLLEKLSAGDRLIVSELTRLGRSLVEVIVLIESLFEKGVEFIAIKQGLRLSEHDLNSRIMVACFAMAGEVERDFISRRTKSALARKKAEGVILGRPKGSTGKSKLDGREDEIRKYLQLGVSKASICKLVGGCAWGTLNNFIKSRDLKGGSLPCYAPTTSMT